MFQKPKAKVRKQEEEKEDEYQALDWENDQMGNEAWYDQDENGYLIEDNEENYFMGDQTKFKEMENILEKKR